MNNKNAKNLITHNSIGYIFHYMLSDKLQNEKNQKNLNFVYIIYRKKTLPHITMWLKTTSDVVCSHCETKYIIKDDE